MTVDYMNNFFFRIAVNAVAMTYKEKQILLQLCHSLDGIHHECNTRNTYCTTNAQHTTEKNLSSVSFNGHILLILGHFTLYLSHCNSEKFSDTLLTIKYRQLDCIWLPVERNQCNVDFVVLTQSLSSSQGSYCVRTHIWICTRKMISRIFLLVYAMDSHEWWFND